MMWLLLFTLTTLLVLLPMLPAFLEWRRPSDVVPLHIDSLDALDPAYLARSFAEQLASALAHGRNRLGRSHLAEVPRLGNWLMTQTEQREGASRTVWHCSGDLRLPPDADLLAEVAATGDLHTAAGRIYRALWSGRTLWLAPHTTVLRWAHGDRVEVPRDCRLAGRVSAERLLTVGSGVTFSLLHAPVVQFALHAGIPVGTPASTAGSSPASTNQATPAPGQHSMPLRRSLGLPSEVAWDAAAGRGTCAHTLRVGAARAWRGDLVCHGDLLLGRSCVVRGSLKANGALQADDGCRIVGNLVATGRIVLGAHCVVLGAVVSETTVEIGAGCVIGAIGAPATVTAPRIVVAAGVVVHGTLWAGEQGSTVADPAQPAALHGLSDAGDDDNPRQVWA